MPRMENALSYRIHQVNRLVDVGEEGDGGRLRAQLRGVVEAPRPPLHRDEGIDLNGAQAAYQPQTDHPFGPEPASQVVDLLRQVLREPSFPEDELETLRNEATGALDTMLNKIADFYEEEVDVAVAALTSLIEPIMMVGIGGTVGVVLIAMYLPIFSIAGKIKAESFEDLWSHPGVAVQLSGFGSLPQLGPCFLGTSQGETQRRQGNSQAPTPAEGWEEKVQLARGNLPNRVPRSRHQQTRESPSNRHPHRARQTSWK